MMRIGFTLPQLAPLAHEARDAARYAREAEALGADSLWVCDRLLAPVNPTIGYMGTETIPPEFRAVLDPFALLAVAATVTERASVGSQVLNAPWYPPAMLARSLTTIDQLSGGRLIPGFGTGWSPEEFETVGVAMDERGARFDECLDALEALWTTNPAEYHGQHWQVPATHVELQPVQQPRPPIYLAAFAPVAMRRVARRADGWLPIVTPGAMDPVADIAVPMAHIRAMAKQAGREPSQLGMILKVYPTADTSLEDIAETIVQSGQEAGVDHAFVELMYLAKSVDHALEITSGVLELARKH